MRRDAGKVGRWSTLYRAGTGSPSHHYRSWSFEVLGIAVCVCMHVHMCVHACACEGEMFNIISTLCIHVQLFPTIVTE